MVPPEIATHIEYPNEREVCEVLPFLLRVVAVAHNHDCLQLLVVEVARSQRHDEVPQANEGGRGIGEQTHHHVIREVGQGGLFAILGKSQNIVFNVVLIDTFMLQGKLNHTINHSWSHIFNMLFKGGT